MVASVVSGTAQLVADVARESRVALEAIDELAHHLVERFGELLHLAVGARDLEARREVALGDGARGERDPLEGPHGAPRHPQPAADADERRREGAEDEVVQQRVERALERVHREDFEELGLDRRDRHADHEDRGGR